MLLKLEAKNVAVCQNLKVVKAWQKAKRTKKVVQKKIYKRLATKKM